MAHLLPGPHLDALLVDLGTHRQAGHQPGLGLVQAAGVPRRRGLQPQSQGPGPMIVGFREELQALPGVLFRFRVAALHFQDQRQLGQGEGQLAWVGRF